MSGPRKLPELSHLTEPEYLLVDRAAEAFLELVARAWKVTGDQALESLWGLKDELLKYFGRAIDHSLDNPNGFLREER